MPRPRTNLTLVHKALILVAVPLAFELVLLGVLGWVLHQTEVEAHLADRAKSIISRTNHVIQSLHNVGEAFLLYDVRTNSDSKERYIKRVGQLDEHLHTLAKEVKDNPRHLEIVRHTKRVAADSLQVLEKQIQVFERGGRLEIKKAEDLEEQLKEIVDELDTIIADERAGQEERTAKQSKDLLKIIFGVIVLSIIVALQAVVLVQRGTARRLGVLMDNSIRLGADQPLAAVLEGNDEIAQIDKVFHKAAATLREASRKERAVIDNAVDVIFSIGEQGNFAAVSPAAIKLWGYAPDELIGENWEMMVDPDDLVRCTNWMEGLRSSESDGEIETRMVRKDQTRIDMRWSAHWSQTERSMFCVAHDITERQELERFKQQFVAMISHDLRTPLMAVQTTLELLAGQTWGELTAKGVMKVEKAEENLQHSINLINNLLDLEKMQSGTIELKPDDVELGPLLARCSNVVTPLAERKFIDLEVADFDGVIWGDEQRLSQVIINLLGNAIKFSPDDSSVRVTIQNTAQSLKISVEDEGPGVPEHMRERIFDRYHQIATKDGKEKEGTGLGLAICKVIIEAHGGTIGVDSKAKGSVFWFELPRTTGVSHNVPSVADVSSRTPIEH